MTSHAHGEHTQMHWLALFFEVGVTYKSHPHVIDYITNDEKVCTVSSRNPHACL